MTKTMTVEDMTPRQAIKMAEQHPDLTPKERQKILAIAFTQQLIDEPSPFGVSAGQELSILWSFSRMINPAIPELDPAFVLDVYKNPAKYRDYK